MGESISSNVSVKGIEVRCIRKGAIPACRQGDIYRMINIGSCYAIYQDGNLVGTVNGASVFEEYFKVMKPKTSPVKIFRKKKTKKKVDKLENAG